MTTPSDLIFYYGPQLVACEAALHTEGAVPRIKEIARIVREAGYTVPELREMMVLQKQYEEANDEIQAAYWTFCRSRNAKPPVLVVPDAYRRRREAVEKLRALRVKEEP